MSRVPALGLALLLSACSSDDSKPAAVPQDPTFTRVVSEVLRAKNCGANGALCHALAAGGFKLGSNDAIYKELLDEDAGGTECTPNAEAGVPARKRVIPNDPENSLLYQKIAVDPPACGDPMPKGQPPLDPPQIQLVYDWIKAGAQND
ncbi:MAG TPA: hypothetical protein VHE30_01730 [Polyangiaceae bacterium]|nr:hypothetical protein [Polyangiaceae bacterium]